MSRVLFFLLLTLVSVLSYGQVVDGIKNSSDRYNAVRDEEYLNPTTTYYQEEPVNPSAPVNNYPNNSNSSPYYQPSYGEFGASNSNIIYPVSVSDPEDEYYSGDYEDDVVGLSQPESDWALRKEQIQQLEKEELEAYLLEESKRGRHRRWFAEFRAQGAVRTEYGVLLPRAQAGYGVFSTDLRMNQIIELGNSFIATYRTWDWQVLKARIFDWEHCSFSMGGGMLFEQYNNEIFGEFTGEVALNYLDGRLYIPCEARIALEEDVIIRTELSASANWLIHGGRHESIFFSLGYAHQNYFQEVKVNGVLLGIHCKFF